MRRFIDREQAAAAGVTEEADVQRLEEILREAGMARLSAAELERKADRVLEWARSFRRGVVS